MQSADRFTQEFKVCVCVREREGFELGDLQPKKKLISKRVPFDSLLSSPSSVKFLEPKSTFRCATVFHSKLEFATLWRIAQ